MKITLESFEQIYKDNCQLVYNLALHYVQNSEDAEEITQDVFIKIHQSLSTFHNKSNLKTWIYRITINTSLDFIKMKNSKKRIFIFGNKNQNKNEYLKTSNFEHPGILMENQENAKILFDAIHTLTENQKTAFLLSKLEGLSNPEIATIMNLSISAVESLIFRGKATLREKLEKKFIEYHKKKKY